MSKFLSEKTLSIENREPIYEKSAGALIIKEGAVSLVEFQNDKGEGVHYKLPAGEVEPGETLAEAAKREAWEEASVEIELGAVAFVYEYQPPRITDCMVTFIRSALLSFAYYKEGLRSQDAGTS